MSKEFHLLPMDQRCSELCSVSSTDYGVATVRVAEAVYSDYVIIYSVIHSHEKQFQAIELYGRVIQR